METRICHICGTEVEKKSACPSCTASVPVWKSPSLMTPEERLAEWYMWNNPGICEIDFGIMRARFELLVGRPVQTIELINYDAIAAEIMGDKEPPTVGQIYELMNKYFPDSVIVVDPDGSLDERSRRN